MPNCNDSAVNKHVREDDTIFITQNLEFNTVDISINIRLYWTNLISDKFIVQIIKRDGCVQPIMIKEIYKDKLLCYYLEFNDANFYNKIVKYDSLKHDRELISNLEFSSDEIESKLSDTFYNLHDLRKSDTSYQSSLKKANDIYTLQKFINSSPFFIDFDLNNEKQVDILKKLFVLTQLELANYLNKYDEHEFVYFRMNMLNVREISSKLDYKFFEENLDRRIDRNKIFNKWFSANKNYLKSVLPEIKADYLNKNVFYFYTEPDFKLMKLMINNNSGKIELSKKYFNPEYIWIHPYTQIIRSKSIIRKYKYDI